MTTTNQGCEGCVFEGQSAPCGDCSRVLPPRNDHYKPASKRITIGAHSFPEPVREALGVDEKYWVVSTDDDVFEATWIGSALDRYRLKAGIIQPSLDDARDQLAATLALYRGEVD
jgi:hypothetical protein